MSFFNNLSRLFGEQLPSGAKAPQANAPQLKLAKKPEKAKPAKSKNPVAPQAQPVVRPIQLSVDNQVALREAQAKAREIIVEAKDEAMAIHTEAEKKARKIEKQLEEQQKFLENKLDRLDDRLSGLERKEDYLEQEKEKIANTKLEIEKTKEKILENLQKVSKLSQDEAKRMLMDGLEKKMASEMAKYIREQEEVAKQEADDKAAQILIDAMKYGATDNVAEYTVSVVDIPSEEIKGKIIGKSGRNIHSFERRTGVDVDLDASPTEVKLSCFDPVRREIARISLERLVKDGRIQPTRIEEVVDKVEKEIEKVIFEAGKQLCHAVGVYNLPSGLIAMLGRFKYRFSYGQNMITHTMEETKIGTKVAHELGLDVNIVKLGCLLHDIGKVAEDPDDNHIALGVRIAKKFGMPQAVVDCIAQHHEDEPFTGPEQMAVYVADAISGARPGARYENHEEYIKRLEDLELIATSYPEVKQAYAVQAGRELRVLLEAEKSKDDDVEVLAVKIRDEIQEKVMVPGSVRVTVIRENRAEVKTK
ncbi:MAG: ribonuclease Y [Candidatus Pacebacteria bacterium CG10_big_fil_rev_8_21_14_0_10_36_11]|nr:ribonuclease Y [Candidatus Pacearchaeota archaeon]PIR64796.1 MAG: ribonuclease Y [Candidatus Pacebacteria bacterium CG10_big_fil_rev_8_21_14_0_10_36_11]PJC43099.1 MAG: ribonuclease Y [Candidatus Pacebacteria bacterium CG_4_9_14_0_2_um_filter_36_8]